MHLSLVHGFSAHFLSCINTINFVSSYKLVFLDVKENIKRYIFIKKGGILRFFVVDVLMYIYTSGTTGHPKPAVITNKR